MNRYRWGLAAVLCVVLGAIVVSGLHLGASTSSPALSVGTDADLIPPSQRLPAPAFAGLQGWLNSPPLTMSSLGGSVVLVDFWTFSCVNCVDTFPHLREFDRLYSPMGLTIIGIHSPEFDFEKSMANVATAVKRLDVTWPVALDPNMATWRAWATQYWPTEYLVDGQGRIAYEHIGEGDYEQTQRAIAALLGANLSVPRTSPSSAGFTMTAELYAGSGRGRLDGSEQYGTPFLSTSYPDPGLPRDQGAIQIVGGWTDEVEFLQSTSPGHVRVRFRANDVFVVAAPAGAAAVDITVTIDGEPVSSARTGADLGSDGSLVVNRSDLFHLLTNVGDRMHVVDLSVPAGFRLYTFTFE